MKIRGAIVLLVLAAAGCAGVNNPDSSSGPASASTDSAASTPDALTAGDPIIATVAGQPIRMDQLVEPMKQADGLRFLLQLAVLQEARNLAQLNGYTITEADIDRERELILTDLRAKMISERAASSKSATPPPDPTADEVNAMLARVLQDRGISEPEFHIKLETNACIRKVFEKDEMSKVTDDEILQRYNIMYGETIRVRVIKLDNLLQVAEAQRRLETDDFAAVAMQMSQDPDSSRIGGQMAPFSAQSMLWPAEFKEVAFKLKVGEVSSPVTVAGAWFIIKLIERIPPVAVTFDAEKDYVAGVVRKERMQARIQAETNILGAAALHDLHISDKELAAQYQARVALTPIAKPAPLVPTEAPTGPATQPAPDAPEFIGPPAAVPANSNSSGTIMPEMTGPPATSPSGAP